MKVVAWSGVAMSCFAAALSDQPTKRYIVPPMICVSGASIVRVMPATPVTLLPAVSGEPSIRS